MGFGREPPRGIPQQVKSPIDEFVREAAEARRPPPEYAPLAPLRELLEEAKERLGARGPGLATGMGCGVGVGAGVVGALGLGASDPALGGFRPVIGVGAGCGAVWWYHGPKQLQSVRLLACRRLARSLL